MEEDSGVKAPVTRLRRRLSVEQTEESKSPAVNTPTKKRGGRKAAKPELELIDENTPENTTTRRATKKTAAKDVAETEEKTVTPSRRTTRIKSNTSIISETALAVDSPRAKRAARRASTAGSDGEAPMTPIRQTRRTRKDSASSVEKEPQLPPKQGIQIAEVIIEEPEGSTIKSTSQPETINDQSDSPTNVRKSPRLLDKNNKITTKMTIEKSSDKPVSEPNLHLLEGSDKSKSKVDIADVSRNATQTSQNRLSISSANLIKELNIEVTRKSNFNKSLSDLETINSIKKRKRTKSWATSTSNDSKFYSDSEIAKTKNNNNIKSPLVLINRYASGDGSLNASLNRDKLSTSISKIKIEASLNRTLENLNKPTDYKSIENIVKESKNEMLSVSQNKAKNDDVKTSEVLKRVPSGDIKTMVFIEDSDSNLDKTKTRHDNEDQCVPVVEHNVGAFSVEINAFTSVLDKNEKNIAHMSEKDSEPIGCEPMDIDETMPENVMPDNQSPEKNQTERKSVSARVHISNIPSEEIVNKSRRKSSITQSSDKSGIETKSTLILSQINSTGDINNVVKSPGVTNNILLSKSVDDLNTTQDNDVKKNVSMHYSTSTPLQNKNIQKFKGIHVNTSIIASQNNDSKISFKDVDSMSDDRYNNTSKNEDIELSDNKVLRELNNTENKINKEKRKKTPKKESNTTKDGIAHSKELKEIMDTDKTLNEKQSNEKDFPFTQQSESESENSSADRKSEEKIIKKNSISEEEIESDDNSTEKSNLIDDEAEEANDDYESGDSQDESERRYEKENEIIDKGETLTTDEEFSDNSDYEKDSFIVSSNEEDEELLDGSDDDLSMSDNELKMTAKSKKKYNERKIKEQKKASKEMFASRHRLNSSNKSSNSEIVVTKKNKRQQISSSESEEDIPIKPKKNNRQRLDSTTKETSVLAEKSELIISNKNSKHLPDTDSSSNDSVPNEKEMTICNETVKESDPLSQIKIELKTPQKGADSTIAFIDSEDINNDRSDKNESTMTQNELLDPLQATLAGDENDDSLSSDNENIIQNYDSVLQDLNKSSKFKNTVCDFSLNIDKKRKNKIKNALIDELNLTLLKSAKKPKMKLVEKDNDINQEKSSKTEDDNASSDSIDLHLLFSEDSNNSDTSSLQNKMNNPSTNSELIIPLKRSEAKTDVRKTKENKDMNQSTEASFNQRINNTNKKRKSQNKENTATNEECASFFIDTLGFHAGSTAKSHNTSLKIKENQSAGNIDLAMDKSVNKSAIEINPIENSDDEAPLEISYQKEKSCKRKSKAQDDIGIVLCETGELEEKTIDKSIAKTPSSEKKIKRRINSIEVLNRPDKILCDTSANQSVLRTPNVGKKIKRQSESNSMELNEVAVDQSLNISQIKTPGSQKVNTGSDSHADELEEKSIDKSIAKTPASEKKIKRRINSIEVLNRPVDNEVVPVKMATSGKKQRNSGSICFSVDNGTPLVPVEICENIAISSKKRKRKSSLNATKEEILPEDDSVKTLNESHTSSSTKKKRKVASKEKIATVAEAVFKEREHDKKILSTNLKNNSTGINDVNKKRNKKRKERDEDEISIQAVKTPKQNVFNQVPRLPPTLLEKLDDVPYKEVPNKKPKLISTTQFLVQGTNKRRTKPSNYLEESIYLNEKSENKRKVKKGLDKPKVLPFVPTASTSTSGFTTNFKINVVPTDIKFEAQSNTISNFRDNYMYSNKIRRLGTYDMYKRQRNVKLSKF